MSRRRSPFTSVGLDRLGLFVPAVMSVGLAFWLATMVRDLVHWRQNETLERRAIIAGRSTGRMVGRVHRRPRPEHTGLRHRPAYLVTAVSLGALAVYIFTGSLLNYLRAGGYLESAAWIFGLATLVAAFFMVTAVAALVTYVTWPDPPRWVREIHASTPLARTPIDRADPDLEPGWGLSAAAMLLPVATIVVVFLVSTDWRWVNRIDELVSDLIIERLWWHELFELFDWLGSPVVAVAIAAVVAVAALRCRPLAVGYPTAVIVGLIVTTTTENLVPRARPDEGPLAGMTDSFPSGRVALATLLAGLLPLGIAALFGTWRPVWPLRIVLGLGVVGGAVYQIEALEHHFSDVVGGALIGLSLVIAVEWAIDHRGWHQWCRGCLWAPESHGPPLLGVFDLHGSSLRLIRVVAHLWASASVVLLTVLTVVYGVPTDPGEGAIFGPHIQQPVQLGLAVLASIGAVLSWKWDALGAVVLALAGSALAVFSAIEYPPITAFALAMMFIVPAVLLWLGWQHRRTMAEIIGLATGTAVLVGATFLGVVAVHDFYFGPTHPDSAARFLEVDDVTWVWVGGLRDDGVVVTAGFEDDDDEPVGLVATPSDGGRPVAVGAEVVADRTARFELAGLEPDTEYRYAIETEEGVDTSRGRGRFRTAPVGSSSFRVAVGACARTDSNGAVFDSIAEADPLFFLQIGDIHYSNIESTDPADYRTAYERMLARPGQAALYRDVPIAHVWDDHDFGPNDSDSTSPGRDAARQAYREVVPHHDLVHGPGGPIQHAFTVGRVRFVLTDTRSEKTDDTMLGDEQVDWLIDEVARSSRTHAVVVWANPVPWIAEPKAGADHWAGYPDERRRIADGFAAAGVDNLVMVSGDAHMVALDDGTNSDYSSDEAGGFPVLHAAAMDRPGGEKGGPFSHGRFGGGGQYGLIDVVDDGDAVTVTLSGVDWEGDVIVEETFTFDG